MKTLQTLIKKCALKVIHGGNCPLLNRLSTNYKTKFNIDFQTFTYTGKMSSNVGMGIADMYNDLEHKPNNKLVKAAYRQLEKELINQFAYTIKHEKIEFEPYTGKGEPYSNSFEMLKDIHNNHMYFFKTESGFGEEKHNEGNVMLNKSGFKIDDYELLINDIFRIVHDIFGHAMNGYGFGPIGEDKAWFTHLKMFSPLAATALSMETRGQNCWVNFGKHLRDGNNELYEKDDSNYLNPSERPFAEQKMNILPSFMTGIEIFEQGNIVKAKYLKNWNPFNGVLIQ